MFMSKKIHICVAWPYAAGDRHIGHLAGAYLPPDIFARYHRLAGNQVLMVSGSDTHGTPVMLRADQEGISPAQVVERYHGRFVEGFLRFGLTFDLYSHTDTQNHWDVTHDLFVRHRARGYIYSEVQQQLYAVDDQRWLPDRYVEGTCPFCGFDRARGDQCDNCGRTYDAVELKNPRSKISGSTRIETRPTEHFFLDLGKANDFLIDWLNRPDKADWRPNVINFARAQAESRELRGRPITRDLDWGITIPVPGYDDKRIYVWYDAVIGYLSATKEWAQITGQPDAWQDWWQEGGEVASFYFIGKDNIPFHAIIWPSMLHAYGPVPGHAWWLKLPTDIPANEYLTLGDFKFSSSFGNVISINEAAERYQVDAWRYALTAMAPEANDSEFTWQEFVRRGQHRAGSQLGQPGQPHVGLHLQAIRRPRAGARPAGHRRSSAADHGAGWFRQRGRALCRAQVQGRPGRRPAAEPGGQPLHQRPGALAADQERPRRGRNQRLRGVAGHRLAEAALCSGVALQLAAIAWLSRLRQPAFWPPVHRTHRRRPRPAPGAAL
jgi:methionyl-tRNA synthetase